MWTKIDDHCMRNRKVRAVGPQAALLYLVGLFHCSETLSDGVISDDDLDLIAPVAWIKPADLPGAVARLLQPLPGHSPFGLWERIEGGYRVHDFLEFNPSAEKVRAERRKNSERARRCRYGESDTDASTPTITDAVSNDAPYPSRSRPVSVSDPDPRPSRPIPRLDGREANGGTDGRTDGINRPNTTDETDKTEDTTVTDPTGSPDETDQVLALLTTEPDAITRAMVAKAISDHATTDPLAVALEHTRWQQKQRRLQATGDGRAIVEDDPVKGWHNSLHRADVKGLYQRPRASPPSETEAIPLAPSGFPLWDDLRQELEAVLGWDNVQHGLAALEPLSLEDGVLTLVAPTAQFRDDVVTRFGHRILGALEMTGHSEIRTRVVVAGEEGLKAVPLQGQVLQAGTGHGQ